MKDENYLYAIKTLVDAYANGKIKVTIGNDDFDYLNHVYDISVVLGLIRNHVYYWLGENIPSCRTKERR